MLTVPWGAPPAPGCWHRTTGWPQAGLGATRSPTVPHIKQNLASVPSPVVPRRGQTEPSGGIPKQQKTPLPASHPTPTPVLTIPTLQSLWEQHRQLLPPQPPAGQYPHTPFPLFPPHQHHCHPLGASHGEIPAPCRAPAAGTGWPGEREAELPGGCWCVTRLRAACSHPAGCVRAPAGLSVPPAGLHRPARADCCRGVREGAGRAFCAWVFVAAQEAGKGPRGAARLRAGEFAGSPRTGRIKAVGAGRLDGGSCWHCWAFQREAAQSPSSEGGFSLPCGESPGQKRPKAEVEVVSCL